MSNQRPDIPSEIKRAVRQKCHFGCVICGLPIYDYEHLVDYAIVKEHKEDNIYLLCPNHHRLKGNNAIPLELIRESIARRKESYTSPQELFFDKCTLVLGNNRILNFSGLLFDIMGRDFMALKFDNKLLIDASFHDLSGNEVMNIRDSEYKLWSGVWDIDWEGQGEVLVFKHKLRDIFLKISFDTSKKVIKVTGKFLINDKAFINITENGIFYRNFLLASENVVARCNVGILIRPKQELIGQSAGYINAAGSNNIAINSKIGFLFEKEFLDSITDN